MHSLKWFWSVGRFDPGWVQAVSGELTAIFAFASFVLLCRYALDTYRLAKASVEQINMAKSEVAKQQRKAAHAAYDRFLKIQNDITGLMANIVDGTFGAQKPSALYPDEWPESAAALQSLSVGALVPAVRLGICLRNVDFAVRDYFNTFDTTGRREHRDAVVRSLTEAGEEAKHLLASLPGDQRS